jgi:hypothetical protein
VAPAAAVDPNRGVDQKSIAAYAAAVAAAVWSSVTDRPSVTQRVPAGSRALTNGASPILGLELSADGLNWLSDRFVGHNVAVAHFLAVSARCVSKHSKKCPQKRLYNEGRTPSHAFDADRDLAKEVERLERSQRLPVVRPGRVRRSTRLHSRRDMPCWRGSLLRRVPTSGGWSLHLRVLSAPNV